VNKGRRYGRWLKRLAYLYVAYLLIALIFLGIDPVTATVNFPSIWQSLTPLLLQLIFAFSFVIIQFVGLFWFLSRGRTYVIYPREYDVSFDDVRGQPAAVKASKEVLRLFLGFKRFREMGGYPPHGILFEGPPGTGKTLMAKAIAGSSSVPFVYASGTSFANMFFGVGNLRVSYLFRKARALSDKYGGAVIFIDELDALGGSRGGIQERFEGKDGSGFWPPKIMFPGGMGMGGMLVNELLVQMDGLVMPRGLFWRHLKRFLLRRKPKVPFYNLLIIGATNRAQTLDPALLRPGRFDRKIHVGLPDGEGREDIGRYYLAKVRHEPIDMERFARMTLGYTPARIKNVINEALIFALQDGRDALRWDDVWQAKLAEEIGLKQPVKYTPKEKEMTAVHEAGHAVASYTLQKEERQIQVITIIKRESALGLVHGMPLEERYSETQKEKLAEIQVFLAGLVAEDIWYGQTTSGPSSDLRAATYFAAQYVGLYGMGQSLISVGAMAPSMMDGDPIRAVLSDPDRKKEVDAILNQCRREVERLLRSKRHAVEGIRDALLDREELIGDEIDELMAQLGEREPLPVPARGDGQEGRMLGSEDGKEAPGDGDGQTPPDPPGGVTPPQPPGDEG
jgi:cell division protease FtsH